MRALLHVFVRLLPFAALWYGVAFVLATLQFGTLEADRVDASKAYHSLYPTFPKLLVHELPKVARGPEAKLLVVGASNVLFGFHPEDLQPDLPNLHVNSLAQGGIPVSVIRETVDVATQMMSPESVKDSTFVVGVWFGSFVTHERMYGADGQSPLTAEGERYGLYVREDGRTRPRFSPETMLALSTALRPVIWADRLGFWADKATRDTLKIAHGAMKTGALDLGLYTFYWTDGPAREFTRAYKDDSLKKRADILPEDRTKWPKAPFEDLVGIGEDLAAQGARLVIVSLPMPEWVRTESKQPEGLRQTLDEWRPELLANKGVSILDLMDLSGDDKFIDDVHPIRSERKVWAEKLVAHLRAQGIAR